MKLLRRRRFFLNSRFQTSLIVISVSYALFGITVMGVALFTPVMLQLGKSGYTSQEAVRAADLLLFLHGNFWAAWLLALAIIALHSLRTSHRIAGPIYRLTQVLERLKVGAVPRPLRQPRRGDYLVEEVALMNEALDVLRQRITGIQGSQRNLAAEIKRCRESSPQLGREDLMSLLQSVAEKDRLLAAEIQAMEVEP